MQHITNKLRFQQIIKCHLVVGDGKKDHIESRGAWNVTIPCGVGELEENDNFETKVLVLVW